MHKLVRCYTLRYALYFMRYAKICASALSFFMCHGFKDHGIYKNVRQ